MLSGELTAYPDGFQPGSILAGYRLEALVGVGGMAVVWRARSLRLDRPVALKILASALATDAAFRLRFIAEARAAALVDDPHIIPVYDADEADGVLFIAMRFVRGGDLRRLVEREGALPPVRAVDFISPVASALDAAHAAGLVHRDVKPANILVDARAGRPDHVYLSDFGIAKAAVSMNLTAVGQALGTPDYMAPEQIEGRAVDGRTDQYALACVTYRLLTEHGPFERESALSVMAAHLHAPPPSLAARRPDLPGAADQVMAKAMAKSPADRYDSCGEFAEALRQALGRAPYIARPRSADPVSPRPSVSEPATPHPPTSAPAAREPDDDVGRRTPTVTARPSVPTPAAVEDHTLTEIAEPGRTHEPGDALDALDLLDVLDEPGAPEQPSGSAAPDEPTAAPDILEVPDVPPVLEVRGGPATRAEATVESEVPHPPPNASPAPAAATVPVLAAPPASTTMVSAPADPRAAQTLVPGPGGVAGEMSATTIVTESVGTTTDPAEIAEISAADDAHLLEAPDEAPDVPEVQHSAEHPDETTIWSRHRRLSSVAVACAVAVVAAVVPFLLISRAHSPSAGHSPNPTQSSGPASAPGRSKTQVRGSSAPYTRVAVNLPAAYGGELSSMAFSPDGTTLAIAGGVGAGQACLWDIATARCTADFPIAHSVAFSPDGTTLAVTNSDSGTADRGSVRLWDVATGKLAGTLTDLHSQGAYSTAFSANGKTLVVGDANDSIYLWDVATRTETTRITSVDHAGFAAVACSPVGATMAAGDVDGTAFLVNIATKQSLFTVTTSATTATDPHPVMVNSVAFSHDGTTLAIGDINGTVALINIETKKAITTLGDPGSKGAESVAFSPDDAILAVADANGSAYLWNLATRRIIATLTDPGSKGITSVAFSPNGKILATGDEDGSASLWYGNFRLSIQVINVTR